MESCQCFKKKPKKIRKLSKVTYVLADIRKKGFSKEKAFSTY